MSLWARFKAWWEAVKAEERALCAKEHALGARRQRNRAEATLVGAATLGAHGTHISGHYESGGYHAFQRRRLRSWGERGLQRHWGVTGRLCIGSSRASSHN